MANKHRGEIAVDLNGEPVKLRLTVNSICELEELDGRSITEILEAVSQPNVKMLLLRKFFWALMLDDNPDATLEDAGKIVTALQGRHTEILADAVAMAFPEAQEGVGEGK